MHIKKLHIVLFSLILSSLSMLSQEGESVPEIQILTEQKHFEAGSAIVLEFLNYKQTKPLLYCSNSYGSTLVSAGINHNTNSYKIPESMQTKTGIVHWELLLDDYYRVKGSFTIVPKEEVAQIETYIGPPTIHANNRDYSMLVAIPVDSLDNPVANNTPVKTKYQFLENEVVQEVPTNNLIAYKNIYAPKKTGRILISSECLNRNSKEYTIDVMAGTPTNFTINYERTHAYADGNQITTFYTSVIKDANNNTVTDGTYVSFIISNTQGAILKTTGSTIKGIAKAKMIHPDKEQEWTVKAHITGMAESNTLTINYKQAVTDFKVIFSKNNRTLSVGPLQSFMQQMIPDGFPVSLSVYDNENLLKRFTQTSYKGHTDFHLKTDAFPNAAYILKIETAGLEKTYKNISLW